MKILVTGATGLVGSAICEQNPLDTLPVRGRTDYDLLQWAHVDRLFETQLPDAVIHLAAKVGGVQANMRAPATFFMENLTMSTHILEAAHKWKVKKLVCFLSTCVFPDPCKLPLRPEYLHDGPPHPSNYGYAYAKRMLAVQCAAYNQEYGTHFVPVIPANIYGRHDNFTLGDSHVVPALIRRFVEAKREGRNVTLWGSGSPLREFIHANDVARLTLAILHHYDSTDPIIISNGQEHSISHLAYTIANAVGFRGDIIWDPTKPEGQHRKPSDPSPLIDNVIKPFLPDFRFTSLETGIQDTVDWFEANYSTARGI